MKSRILAIFVIVVVISLIIIPASLNGQTSIGDHYTVTFKETGLQNGTRWYVSVGAFVQYSNNSTILFSEPNGTYNFTIGGVKDYKPLPSTFTVSVKGHNVSLVIVWVPVTYPVTFIESGLPSNTFWNVTLGNETSTTSNSTITFLVKNGTYHYSIPNVKGTASSTPNGTIEVNGEPTKVFVEFTLPIKFTFYEQGLPPGTEWSIFINGTYYNSTLSYISVTLPNGTYSYLVLVPQNYEANPAHGKINYSNNLTFVKVTSLLIYEIVIAILALLIGLSTTAYLRARKRIKTRKSREEN